MITTKTAIRNHGLRKLSRGAGQIPVQLRERRNFRFDAELDLSAESNRLRRSGDHLPRLPAKAQPKLQVVPRRLDVAPTGKAIAAFAALVERLDALAQERGRPWWRRIVG